jgi:hypothetical protein
MEKNLSGVFFLTLRPEESAEQLGRQTVGDIWGQVRT